MPPIEDPILTTIRVGRHDLPGVWKYMLPEDFTWLEPPKERLATCDDCYKANLGECRDDCRCCTYFPQLPNFMFGLALRRGTAQEQLTTLIEAGHALPTGLMASPQKFHSAVAAHARDLFGQLPEMVCPFVQPKTFACGVYAFRNSVCSTFFCANDHGEQGAKYWDKVQALVGRLETVLSQWAMEEIGIDLADYLGRLDRLAPEVERLTDPDTDGWSRHAREVLWGDWFGREVELFERCAERVMTNRARLFEIARQRPLGEALLFERAVRDWIPKELRDHVPRVADEPGQGESVDTQWYELQLATRRLWALPFNEGRVELHPDVTISANPNVAPAPGGGSKSQLLTLDQFQLQLTDAEARLLRMFETPRQLGEQLFMRAEIEALEDPRGFLAECMRNGIVIVSTTG